MAKKKPIKLRVLEGNRGKGRIPIEPEPPHISPNPPSHLDEYALEEWRRVCEGLEVMGILYEIDQATLGAYCDAYSRWRAASEELNELKKKSRLNALVLKTVSGNWIQQPLIGIANKAAGDMVRHAAEFGMTPSARARLAVDPGKGKRSKFDGLIGNTGGKK
jgi:P27 family predicted phage terminase small subunit